MGANAVTTFPTYTTGQVLEAADLNITNCGVPTFADSTARDGAFGGTGEKTLAEGQLCYLEDANIVQYYDGSSWATVGPITPATPGLELVKTQTIGTTVASVAVTNVFSATYDAYEIIITGGVGSGNNNINLQLGATVTGYYRFSVVGNYNANTVTGIGQQNQTNFQFVGTTNTDNIALSVRLLSPYLAKPTVVAATATQVTTTGTAGCTNGYLANTTSYTDFTILVATGSMTGGQIRVYGYKN